MGQNNIIELNGKQYDAVTGALLGESRVKATSVSRTEAPRHQGRVIDGFVRQSQTHINLAPQATKLSPAKAIPAGQVRNATGKKMDIQRVNAKPAQAHKPERAQTLMRHVVRKPKIDMKPAIKTTGPAEMMAKPASELATQLEKKLSVTQIDPIRLAHANHIAKSPHIRKFDKPRVEHAVADRPRQYANSTNRPMHQEFHRGAKPQPIASRSVALEQAAQRLKSRQNSTDMFEAALIHATSHEEPHHKAGGRRAIRRHRMVNAVAGIAAFLVIGGFITYINMPGIELRVASVHAGFHAEMPAYRPTGYALTGGVKASSGRVEMTYRSGDSSYKVTQVASNWNSETLLDQNTEQRGAPSQTIQSEGRIIYIYKNNATWVNGGVRYDISGNANLNADDLISLATSM